MSWWTRAKENHAFYRKYRGRTEVAMIGVILAAVGGGTLYLDARHQLIGRAATATLLEHITQCTVEYHFIGEEKQKAQWPCDMAEETQRRVGFTKFKISRDFIARLQFPLADGRTHEAKVDDIQLGSISLPVGATLPVLHAPDDPSDVRAKLSWERVKIWLIVLAVGLAFLALALRGPLVALFGWAVRGRTSGARDAMMTSGRLRR
jgi:hypothetical protein